MGRLQTSKLSRQATFLPLPAATDPGSAGSSQPMRRLRSWAALSAWSSPLRPGRWCGGVGSGSSRNNWLSSARRAVVAVQQLDAAGRQRRELALEPGQVHLGLRVLGVEHHVTRQAGDARPVGLARCAQRVGDRRQLVQIHVAGQKGQAQDQLGEHRAQREHVDGRRVRPRVEQQLGRLVPARDHLAGHVVSRVGEQPASPKLAVLSVPVDVQTKTERRAN